MLLKGVYAIFITIYKKNAGTDFFSILFSFMILGAQTEWKNFLQIINQIYNKKIKNNQPNL